MNRKWETKTADESALEYAPIQWVRESDRNTSVRNGFKAGFQARDEEVKQLQELLGECKNMIKQLVDSSLYSAEETERIKNEIYPTIETCGCESPCDCTYPVGWIDLDQHKYHCYGTEIMADEFLQKIKGDGDGNAMKCKIRFKVGYWIYRFGYSVCMFGLKVGAIDKEKFLKHWQAASDEK